MWVFFFLILYAFSHEHNWWEKKKNASNKNGFDCSINADTEVTVWPWMTRMLMKAYTCIEEEEKKQKYISFLTIYTWYTRMTHQPCHWCQRCCGLLRYCKHTSVKPHHRCHGISIAVACCSAAHPQAKPQHLGKSCQRCQWILTHFMLTLPALSHHNSSHSNHYFTSA